MSGSHSISLSQSDVLLFAASIGGAFLVFGMGCGLCAWRIIRRRRRDADLFEAIALARRSAYTARLSRKLDGSDVPVLWEILPEEDDSLEEIMKPLSLTVTDRRVHVGCLIRLPSDEGDTGLAIGVSEECMREWHWSETRWLNEVILNARAKAT